MKYLVNKKSLRAGGVGVLRLVFRLNPLSMDSHYIDVEIDEVKHNGSETVFVCSGLDIPKLPVRIIPIIGGKALPSTSSFSINRVNREISSGNYWVHEIFGER